MADQNMLTDYQNYSDEAELTEDVFHQYQSAQQEWRTAADENEKFVFNVHWTQDQIKRLKARGQAPVTINAITWAIEQLKAMLTANKPRFMATAREDSDIKKAEVIKALITYIWDISDGNSVLKQAVTDYAIMGSGVLMAYIDPYADSGRGEVKITTLDRRDVYPDPNSKDYLWRDAAHVIATNYMTMEQIKMHYPDFDFDGALMYESQRTNDSQRVAQENQVFSGEQKDANATIYRILTRQTKKMRSMNHVADPYSGEEYHFDEKEMQAYAQKMAVSWGGNIVTEDREVQSMIQGLDEGIKTGGTQPTGDSTFLYTPEPQVDPQGQLIEFDPVIVELIPIRALIESGAIAVRKIKIPRVYQCITIGEKKYWSGWMPFDSYSIVPINNMWNKTPYPTSDVTMCRSQQEMLNKLNSLIIANAASATNQKVFLPRGSQDKARLEEELNRAGSAVIEFDAEIGQPVIVGAQQLPTALYQQIELYISMIERQFGIYALMQGNSDAAPVTFKGTLAMDEFGQRRVKSKKDDIETSLNQLARIVIQMARHVYTEEKIIRLVEPTGEITEVGINTIEYDDFGQAVSRMNDIQTGIYDVIVVSGSTLPSNRYALMEYYMELYQMGLIDQVEVLKKSEVVDVEGVLERFSYVRQLESQLQGLQEQIKNLEGDLQTASREELHAKKRLELEKFKSDLDGIKSNAAASAKILQSQLQTDAMMQRQSSEDGPRVQL